MASPRRLKLPAVIELLDRLWEEKASDLLITAGSPPLIRVDGSLRRLEGTETFDAADTEAFVMNLMDGDTKVRFRRIKQLDFSFSYRELGRVRANVFRQKGSLAVALRVIPNQIPTFEELGLPPIVEKWAMLPQGFILVIGATGSGKSTTLASMVAFINANRPVHIITVEDPIEYVHDHNVAAVEQREVGEDTESFAMALRAILREDPDVVLVGEMRDLDSISSALTIAETGHLVFATLHANDTGQALDRIVDVFPGVEQEQIRLQLANTLSGILYQQLIPRKGGGRVAAFEILTGTAAARNLIREGKSRQIRNVVATGQREGMQTLEANLSELVRQGTVSYEDAVARSLYPKEIANPMAPPPAEPEGRRGRRR